MNWNIMIILIASFWANTFLFAQNDAFFNMANANKLEQEALAKEYLQKQIDISKSLYHSSEYYTGLDTLQNALDKVLPFLDEKDNLISDSYNNLAVFYNQLSNYKQADEYYQKAKKIREKYNPHTEILANTYHSISTLYKRTRDNEQAKKYANKAINIYKTLPNLSDETRLNAAYANLAGIYHNEKKYQVSNQYFRIAINGNLDYKHIVTCLNSLGENYLEMEKYDSSYFYFQKAIQLDKQIAKNKKNSKKDHIYINLGKYFYEKPNSEYAMAFAALDLAMLYNEAKYGDNSNDVALVYTHIGRTHFLQKDYEKALENYQKAIHIFVPSFKDTTDFYINPKNLAAEDKTNLLLALQRKGEIFQAKHKETKAKKDIETALETYQLAAALIDTIRISYFVEESKFSLAEKALPIYENAIEAAIINNNIALAFEFSEKGKAIVLLEATQGRDAKKALPDSLVMQEYETKKNITFYEKKIFVEQYKAEKDTAKLQIYEAKLFDAQRKLEDLKRLFKSNFPKYHSEKYDIKTVSAKDIQANILQQNVFEQFTTEKKAFIEYFVGDSNIYIFTITASDIFIDTAKKTADFEQKINDFRKILSEDGDNSQENYTLFYELSTYFYQILLEKPLSHISEIQNLIIVPDAHLLYLPFAALSKKMPNDKHLEMSEYDLSLFVNNGYSISYNYSATLLLKEQEYKKGKQQQEYNFLGFAPITFNKLKSSLETNKKLDTLKFSRSEILFIDSLLDGKMFLDSTATQKRFLELAEKAKIIHISSHAFVSDSQPMQSEIAFADSMLHIYEIYNLPLSAELAVLSACQTASGKIVRGEGIMSLARGFMYAGCPSVVSSLWSVNDKATTELIKAFYANLKAGQAKDKALQNAQKKLMQQKANPYYWAAFVQIGDTKAIYNKNKVFQIVVFGFLSALMFIFAVMKKRKFKQKN